MLLLFPGCHGQHPPAPQTSSCWFGGADAGAGDDDCKDSIKHESEEIRIGVVHSSHISWSDESKCKHHHSSPPSLAPPQVPIAVIPMVPVVTATPSLPLTTAIASATTPLNVASPYAKKPCSPPQQNHRHLLCATQVKVEPTPIACGKPGPPPQLPQQVHVPYAASMNGPASHLLAQQRANGAVMEDMRAGTREVHNKLEKNRRAHLKECFETLKKNVPNVDEKKTSNLSVLRSALRYIQMDQFAFST
uniref:Max-binding protein MNT n=1 Tax=Knipowitschia caucasica TaxID=637954 RepID=A0AAV2J9L0_KNICA